MIRALHGVVVFLFAAVFSAISFSDSEIRTSHSPFDVQSKQLLSETHSVDLFVLPSFEATPQTINTNTGKIEAHNLVPPQMVIMAAKEEKKEKKDKDKNQDNDAKKKDTTIKDKKKKDAKDSGKKNDKEIEKNEIRIDSKNIPAPLKEMIGQRLVNHQREMKSKAMSWFEDLISEVDFEVELSIEDIKYSFELGEVKIRFEAGAALEGSGDDVD